MKKLILAFLFSSVVVAHAQNVVQQNGPITPGHAVSWTTNGVIQDAGSAANGALNSIGITNNGTPALCINSGAPSGPYNRFCLGTGLTTNATISTQNIGGATAQPFSFNINGTTLTLPLTVGINGQCLISSGSASPMTWGTCGGGGGGSVSITAGTGLTVSPSPLTGTGTIGISSIIAAGGPTGDGQDVPVITYNAQGQLTVVTTTPIAPPFSAITGSAACTQLPALTGDLTTPAGSCATTFATVNSNVGSFGSSTSIPTFTVNGKGLITAASGNAVIAPAGTLTGTTLASSVVTSSLTSTGTLVGGATGAGFTVALSTSTVTGTLGVGNGGTGQTTFTSNLPLLGNGASAIAQGTVSGNTTKFGTVSGALVNGNCIQADASGNLVDSGGVCGGGSGSGTVASGTAGQFAYYVTSTNAVAGNANLTISSSAVTIGVAGSAVGTLKFANATSGTVIITPPTGALSGTLTLPNTTDTLIGKATTDTLTNKTYDTAGTGNVFKINGTGITAISGNTAKVGSISGSLTSGNCIKSDASGNLIDSGGACGSGGTPGGSNTQVQFNNSSAFGGSANLTWVSPTLTIGASGVTGKVALAGSTSGSTGIVAAAAASGTLTLPSATDTLIAKATTDTLTNKTYDTAGTGNVFKINGTGITAISGNTATVGTTSGTLTNGDCVSIDASGNLVDAGGTCTTGGGGGTVTAGSQNGIAYYSAPMTGTTVSATSPLANAVLITSGVSVPSLSLTLPSMVQGNITKVGTVTVGVWNGTILSGQYGGTGVSNSGNTITVAGNFVGGVGPITINAASAGGSSVTLPATGTLVNTAVTTLSSLVSVSSITTGSWQATKIGLQYGGTNVDLSATGGTSQVLKQSAGHVISVGQLACADLSTAAASCSTDTTNASNISSGTLPSARLTGNYTGITGVGTISAGTWQGTAIDLSTYVTGNLAYTHLDSGIGASSSTFWRGDGHWGAPVVTNCTPYASAQTALNSGGVITVCPGSYSGAALTFTANLPTWLFGYGVTITSTAGQDCVQAVGTSRALPVIGGIYGLTCIGSGTSTNGIKVVYTNNSSTGGTSFVLKDLNFQGYTYALNFVGVWNAFVNTINCIAPTGACVALLPNGSGPANGGTFFSNITAYCKQYDGTYCSAGTMGIGFLVESDAGSYWHHIQSWGSTGPGFLVQPPSAGCNGGGCGVGNEWITDAIMDTALNAGGGCTALAVRDCGDGFRFDTSSGTYGGGKISTVLCSQCWGTFGQNAGFVASGTNSLPIIDVRITGGEFIDNASAGVVVDGAYIFRLVNSTVANNGWPAPNGGSCLGAPGVELGTAHTTQDIQVSDNYIGNSSSFAQGTGSVSCQTTSVTATQSGGVPTYLDNSIVSNNILKHYGSGGAEFNYTASSTNLQAGNL